VISSMTEISLLSLIRKDKGRHAFIFHGPSYKYPHDQRGDQLSDRRTYCSEARRERRGDLMEAKGGLFVAEEGAIH
jgi:hypothetical protein